MPMIEMSLDRSYGKVEFALRTGVRSIAGNMTSVATTLSEDDIENLAQFIANLN